jgi:hypothetical protein
MMYAVEITSDAMIYILSFMTVDSGFQVILRVLSQQLERL